MSDAHRHLLIGLFEAAVAAAHPRTCLTAHLPVLPARGRLIIVGAGKAAAAMAVVAESHYRGQYGRADALDRIVGFTTAPHGALQSLPAPHPSIIEIVEARHPTPDAASQAAAERTLALVQSATTDDLVVVLLSGGASALWAAPTAGIDLADKTALTRGLLKSGADIHEMNTVRRHISRIKGGRLRQAGAAAPMLTLAISDVPGDDPQTIGSGPTVADPTTLADARHVIATRRARMDELQLSVPESIERALLDPANETPKPDDALFRSGAYRIIATPVVSLRAAAELARSRGYDVENLGDRVTGEARDVAVQHANLARRMHADGRRVAIISGGELEVTVRNRAGQGGRSQEYALALAIALEGLPGVSALAADTDGIDGGEGRTSDPAGAIIDATTLVRSGHVRAQKFLDNNDATPFFAALGDLVTTGPTHTNVNDFRAILHRPLMPMLLHHPQRLKHSIGAAWWLLRTVALAGFCLVALADAAHADLKLCNATSSRIGVAIGYQDNKGWATEGWWNIAAQTCETLLKGTLPSRYYYVYAVDYDRGGEWTGQNFMCTSDRIFTIRGVQDCQRRTYKRTGFFEVDVGDSQDWTIRLTDPADASRATR